MRTLSLSTLLVLAGSTAAAQTPAPAPAPLQVVPAVPAPPGNARVFVRQFGTARRPNVIRFRNDSAFNNQASLGIEITATGTKRDTLGVFVTRVVPNGPAEKAGIIEGDRIVSINDIQLRSEAADLDDPYIAGIPVHRVQREVVKLTPGATAKLRVYSQGKFKNVEVVVGKRSDVMRKKALSGHMRIGAAGSPEVGLSLAPEVAATFDMVPASEEPAIHVEGADVLQAAPAPVHIIRSELEGNVGGKVFEIQRRANPVISLDGRAMFVAPRPAAPALTPDVMISNEHSHTIEL
jgi:membrane-associated protease RseP (regulator of RpoE activity)